MSQLQELQATVDSTVSQLLANGASHEEVIISYEIKLERAQTLLRQVNNAINMSHGLRTGLINTNQATALVEAIDYIIRGSHDLVADLNSINGSGIHEVIEPTRFNMIVSSILEIADSRFVGDSFWRIIKNKFKKINHFTTKFLDAPNPHQHLTEDIKKDEVGLFPAHTLDLANQ